MSYHIYLVSMTVILSITTKPWKGQPNQLHMSQSFMMFTILMLMKYDSLGSKSSPSKKMKSV
jgi:hypothetical protein